MLRGTAPKKKFPADKQPLEIRESFYSDLGGGEKVENLLQKTGILGVFFWGGVIAKRHEKTRESTVRGLFRVRETFRVPVGKR